MDCFNILFSITKLDTSKSTVLFDEITSIKNVFWQLPAASKHANSCSTPCSVEFFIYFYQKPRF